MDWTLSVIYSLVALAAIYIIYLMIYSTDNAVIPDDEIITANASSSTEIELPEQTSVVPTIVGVYTDEEVDEMVAEMTQQTLTSLDQEANKWSTERMQEVKPQNGPFEFATLSEPTSASITSDLQGQHPSCDMGAIKEFKLTKQDDGSYVTELNCISDGFTRGDTRSTSWDTYSDNFRYLDRHNVDCGEQAIRDYSLEVDGGRMRYIYTCSKQKNGLTSFTHRVTPVVTYGSLEPSELTKIGVQCEDDELLTQFNLNSNDNEYSYSYTCAR